MLHSGKNTSYQKIFREPRVKTNCIHFKHTRKKKNSMLVSCLEKTVMVKQLLDTLFKIHVHEITLYHFNYLNQWYCHQNSVLNEFFCSKRMDPHICMRVMYWSARKHIHPIINRNTQTQKKAGDSNPSQRWHHSLPVIKNRLQKEFPVPPPLLHIPKNEQEQVTH